MEVKELIEPLSEVIRTYPRSGGRDRDGLKILRGGKIWGEGSADPEEVAKLLLGTQFDGKKATASCFKAASLVTAHYGWSLSWREDFSLGAYLISCLVKAEFYKVWKDFSTRGRPDYWLAATKKQVLEFPEIEKTAAFKPFPDWSSSKDELGNRLVKPSHPQLKETEWFPDASHLRNAYGIDEFGNPSTQKWNSQKAPHEEFTRIQPMQWVNAIHALESVGYRINEEVLEIAEAIDKDKSRRLPDSLEDFEERVKAFDNLIDTLNKKDSKREEAESDRKELINEHKAIRSRRSAFTRAIRRANERKGSAFYHRVFADYRGRLYLHNSGLSYQGNDLQRGLIEFAEGRKVTKPDWRFIWLHLANTWGEKGSWQERVETAKSMQADVLRFAQNPIQTYDEWSRAGDKWQFIRTCFEIRDLLDNPDRDSHLICEIDQSTSALQHMALVMDDPQMMRQVNFGPEFSDIYQIIGDSLELNGEASPQHRRKIAKAALIPFGYGSGVKKIAEAFDELDIPCLVAMNYKERFRLAQHVEKQILKHLKSAGRYKNNMKKLADKLLADGKDHFYWNTPSGFEVHHYKQVEKKERERVLIGQNNGKDEYAKLVAYKPETEPDVKRLKSGLPPNFIHSIDASVIHSLLVHFQNRITCVHDAIGAHAGTLHEVVEMFYLKLNILYTGFNPKMYFDRDMQGIKVPLLQTAKGISPATSALLINSQHSLT